MMLSDLDRQRLVSGAMTMGELSALIDIFGLGCVEAKPEGDEWRVDLDSGLATGFGPTIHQALCAALTDWIEEMLTTHPAGTSPGEEP